MSVFKRYSNFKLIELMYFKIRTYFVLRNAKIIRFPIDIRGKKFMHIGKNFTTGYYCRLEAYPRHDQTVLYIGENFQMNDNVHISAMECVRIGNNVLLASKIFISDISHGSYNGDDQDSSPNSIPKNRVLSSKPIVIEDNVWIGESVSVLAGVKIEKGTIVGANSVVSKSLPANVIAVGNPAKPIKKFNFNTQKWEKINIKN